MSNIRHFIEDSAFVELLSYTRILKRVLTRFEKGREKKEAKEYLEIAKNMYNDLENVLILTPEFDIYAKFLPELNEIKNIINHLATEKFTKVDLSKYRKRIEEIAEKIEKERDKIYSRRYHPWDQSYLV